MSTISLGTKTHVLTVVFELSWLVPHAKYTATIDKDDNVASQIYGMKSFVADSTGDGVGITILQHVTDLPNDTWKIVVRGPQGSHQKNVVTVSQGPIKGKA